MATGGRKQVLKGTTRPGWFAPVVVVLMLAGAVAAFLGYEELGKTQRDPVRGYGGIGALLAAGVVSLLLAAATKREIEVDTTGIKERRGLGKTVEIRWSEPHDYYYLAVSGASTPTVEHASVRTADGRRIDVGDVKIPEHPNARVPGLVEQYSTAANWPKIKERLDGGQDVEFGAVKLSSERIELGELSRPAEGGIVLQIERGLVRVGSAGTWQSSQISVREVANYPCLLRALGQLSQALPPS